MMYVIDTYVVKNTSINKHLIECTCGYRFSHPTYTYEIICIKCLKKCIIPQLIFKYKGTMSSMLNK